MTNLVIFIVNNHDTLGYSFNVCQVLQCVEILQYFSSFYCLATAIEVDKTTHEIHSIFARESSSTQVRSGNIESHFLKLNKSLITKLIL